MRITRPDGTTIEISAEAVYAAISAFLAFYYALIVHFAS